MESTGFIKPALVVSLTEPCNVAPQVITLGGSQEGFHVSFDSLLNIVRTVVFIR
ncbi:MAG: hypothetical protein JRN35_10070 [Nitrososphaerota archaeon]|nr:hypothetical protein [Nitrososphaerota archaeon]